jgi:hypothetical protein
MPGKKYTVDNWLKEEMKDEEFRALWEARDEAYQKIAAALGKRGRPGL